MSYIFFIIFLIPSLYYFYFLLIIRSGIKKVKKNKLSFQNNSYVSIIIPFRNESENIMNCLSSLENQSFDKSRYEVIFVDDFSEDDTFEKLDKANKSFNIKVISVPIGFSPNSHKKRAIRFGIENSKGEIIVTTDADCIHNTEWLRTIISYFDEDTGLVSAPVIFKSNNSIFQQIQKLEFAGLILTGAGLIGNKTPTICNGANLAYKEKVFSSVNGFNDNINLSSGDDEFLMQKIAKQKIYKIRFCFEKDAIAFTNANKNLSEFFNQRKRWASKGLFYSDKFLIVKLILIYIFFLLLMIELMVGIIISNFYLVILFITLLIKLAIEYSILTEGKKLLYDRINLIHFIIAEIFHIPYIIIGGFAGSIGGLNWKNRKVKR